jgi:hypothetical protein
MRVSQSLWLGTAASLHATANAFGGLGKAIYQQPKGARVGAADQQESRFDREHAFRNISGLM